MDANNQADPYFYKQTGGRSTTPSFQHSHHSRHNIIHRCMGVHICKSTPCHECSKNHHAWLNAYYTPLHAHQGGPDSGDPGSGSGSNNGTGSNDGSDSNIANDSDSGCNDGSKSKHGGARASDVWYEFQF